MRFVGVIIFCMLSTPVLAQSANLYISKCTKDAENLFKEHVKLDGQIIFTHVPRGLIVSIDETVFFNENQEKIKQDGIVILNQIGKVLNLLDNDFVIEGHTEATNPELSIYNSNWELSLARANNITKYLMRCVKVSPEKLFTVGFGEFMPFADNVSQDAQLNNRIDFVILDYEASR